MPTGLLAHSIADLLHSRRRTLSSILGVLLAMAFISGSFIAVDSSTRGTLDAVLSQLNGHYSVSGSFGSPTAMNLAADLRTVPGVNEVNPTASLYTEDMGLWNASSRGNYTSGGQGYATDPGNLPRFLRDAPHQGTMALGNGTIVLSQELARSSGARINWTFFVGHVVYDPLTSNTTWQYVNLTVEGIVEAQPNYYGGPYYMVPVQEQQVYYGSSFFIIGAETLTWMRSRFTQWYDPGWNMEIWVDVDRLVNPYDLDASRRNLARLERNIAAVAAPYGGYTNNSISNALTAYEGVITGQRTLFFLMSTPVILLGLYLGAVGIDLSHAERRRELAVLKARGAGGRQLVGLLILEAVLGGLLAALLGLVFGALLSRFLIDAVSAFSFYGPVRRDYFFIHRDTIILVFLLGAALSAIVSYRSAKRTAGLAVVETLRYYAPGETKIQYRPALDIVMVSVALLAYVGLLYSRAVSGSFLLFFLAPVLIFMIPVSPILLLVGGTRLLTRSTGRVYEWASLAFRPVARNLHHVISRNLSRNPRRSANIAVIIALGIGFALFVLATFASQTAHDEQALRNTIGADAYVAPITDSADFASRIAAVPGIAGVSRIEYSSAAADYGYPSIMAIDPSTYFDVTQPAPLYFQSPVGLAEAKQILETPGKALVSKAYYDNAYLAVGDRITIYQTVYAMNGSSRRFDLNVTVGGIVRGLPASQGGYMPIPGTFSDLPNAIYVGTVSYGPFAQAIRDFVGPTYYNPSGTPAYLADLSPEADWSAVKDELLALGMGQVRMYEEERETLTSNPFLRSFRGFMDIEIAFIGVVLTAGLGLIIFAASLERDQEFASMIARGCSGWQAAALLVGEATAILIIGAAVGIGVGVGAGFSTLQLIQPTSGETLIPYAFVLPLDAILFLGLAPLAMVLTAVLIAARTARMNVARVLKMRGG